MTEPDPIRQTAETLAKRIVDYVAAKADHNCIIRHSIGVWVADAIEAALREQNSDALRVLASATRKVLSSELVALVEAEMRRGLARWRAETSSIRTKTDE